MKKLISILLVAVLVLGMFPATTLTAFAAPTEETISFNSLSQRVSQTTTSQVWKSDNITFTNNKGSSSTNVANYSNPVRIYGKSDLIIECSAGKMTSILFVSNSGNDYKASLNSSLTAAGVTFSNSGNNYTVTFAEGVESFSFQNASTKQIRLHSMTVTYEAGGSTEPDVPVCQHEETELQNEAEASCTTDGYTGDEVCLDCGETVTEGEVIPAAHTYVGGICSVCGEAKPAGYLEAAVATLKSTDQVIVTVINTDGNTYALTNGGGTSNAPAATKVSVTDGTIDAEDVTDALIWNIVYNNGNIEIYPKDTTSTWLYCTATNNGVRVGTNTNKTFTIDASSGYLKHTGTSRYIGVYNNQDWRCYTSVNNNIAGQTLKFYKLSGGTTESCQHTNTEPIPAVAATCSEGGWTEGVKCSDCGEILTAPTATAVRPHNFVDGICAYEDCGMYEHQAELMTTLPGNGDKIIIHHVKNNLALGLEVVQSNDLAGISTTPVDGKLTYYTSVAQLTVGLADGEYTFQNANGGYLTTDEGNALYFAEALTDNGKWNIALEDGKFIIDNAYATNDTGTLTLEVYGGAFTSYSYGNNNPTDAYKMHLYLVEKGEDTCLHPNAYELDDGYAAQCGVPGMTNSWYCPDCEITTVPQETIPALEHNFVNGTCTNDGCGAQDPLYTLPGRYYIAATRNNGSYYMTSDLGTSSTKRYTAVETGLETLPTEITDPAFGYVFIVTRNEDGTFSIQAEGIPGDNYLGWSSGNSGILTADKNINFTATANEDGTFTFANSANRYLSLNNSGDDWFAWYESVQKRDLTLIPVTGAETAPAASADGRYFATAEEAIAAAAEEGQTVTLLAAAGNVQVTGDLVIDLNGNSIASLTISGTLKAYDSKATTAAASGAKIESVNAGEIVMDNTVDDVRYITLNDNGIYSFHALELTLTAVTLRTRGVDENGAAIPGAGLYYKAAIVCDPTLAAYVNENREACSFGLVLSLVNMPGSDFMTETEDAYTVATAELESSKVFTSGILNNIFKHGLDAEENATRGEDNIYANAYLNLNGTIYMADTTANDTADAENFDGAVFSLMTVMQALDTSYATMEDSNPHKALLLDFYTKWYDAMDDWGLDNLNADYVPPVAE